MSEKTYPCIKILQRPEAPRFVIFAAPAREIASWAIVERHTPESQNGPQRIEKRYKVQSIKSYFEVDPKNTIPTAIIVAFKEGPSVQVGEGTAQTQVTVTWSDENKPGVIVDGQHRLAGAAAYNPDTLLCVVGILNADEAEIAFQFIVINNKVARVSADHLRSLALHYDREVLGERLRKVRLQLSPNIRFVGFAQKQDDSPFKGIVALSSTPDDQCYVAAAAIEEAVRALVAIGQKQLSDDDDLLVAVFFAIWKAIRSKWESAWNKDSKLLRKVSIVVMTSLVGHHLISRSDLGELNIYDPAEVEQFTLKILDKLNIEFWSRDWALSSLDTNAGRKILRDSLDQIMRNTPDNWEDQVALLSPA